MYKLFVKAHAGWHTVHQDKHMTESGYMLAWKLIICFFLMCAFSKCDHLRLKSKMLRANNLGNNCAEILGVASTCRGYVPAYDWTRNRQRASFVWICTEQRSIPMGKCSEHNAFCCRLTSRVMSRGHVPLACISNGTHTSLFFRYKLVAWCIFRTLSWYSFPSKSQELPPIKVHPRFIQGGLVIIFHDTMPCMSAALEIQHDSETIDYKWTQRARCSTATWKTVHATQSTISNK